jgi:hypothetical protein
VHGNGFGTFYDVGDACTKCSEPAGPPHSIPVDGPVEARPPIVVKMANAIADPTSTVSYELDVADSCVGPVRGVDVAEVGGADPGTAVSVA